MSKLAKKTVPFTRSSLNLSQARLAAVERRLDAFIWSANVRTFEFSFVSPQAPVLTGFGVSVWLKQPHFWELHLHPDDRDAFMNAVTEANLTKQPFDMEHRFIGAEGHVLWLHTEVQVVQLSGVHNYEFNGLSVDITSAKESKARLAAVYETMTFFMESKTFIEAAPNVLEAIGTYLGWEVGVLWIIDRSNGLLDVLDVWCSPRSASLKSVLTKSHRHHWGRGYGMVGSVRDSKFPEWTLDIHSDRRFSKDYSHLSKDFRTGFCFPIQTRENFYGVFEFFSMEGKKLDEGLLKTAAIFGGQAASFIETAIARDRNAQCFQSELRERQHAESLAGDLHRAVRVRDDFLSICSHELKTPITSLKLQTQMASRQLDRFGSRAFTQERVKKLLDCSCKQIERLNKLIENMLDVSRISAGRLLLSLEKIDLSLLVQEVVGRFSEQLKAADILIELDLTPSLFIWGDLNRIDQVITSLLTNSIQYGLGKPIQISVYLEGETAKITFQDYGMGISRENMGRIFERFERAISSTSISGLGLGLYVSREIVHAHHGSIQVASKLGIGSYFEVSLPSNFNSTESMD